MSLSSDITLALQEKRQLEGEESVTQFNNVCLKALDPAMLSFSYYVADKTGEKYNKPRLYDGTPNPNWPLKSDGTPEDVPRDPAERKEFFASIKHHTMEDWMNRIQSGEFDKVEVIKTKPKPSDPSEHKHEDVGDLDMTITDETTDETEQAVEAVEISTEKETAPAIPETKPKTQAEKDAEAEALLPPELRLSKEPEPDKMLMNIKDLSASDQVDLLLKYNKSVGTPPALKMLNTLKAIQSNKPHPVIRLREAVEDLARGVVGPATDESLEERLAEIEARLSKHDDSLKKLTDFIKSALGKVPEMIKAEIVKRFS